MPKRRKIEFAVDQTWAVNKAELPLAQPEVKEGCMGTLPTIEKLLEWADDLHPLGRICPDCRMEVSMAEPGIREVPVREVVYSKLLGIIGQKAMVYYHADCENTGLDGVIEEYERKLKESLVTEAIRQKGISDRQRRYFRRKRLEEEGIAAHEMLKELVAQTWVRKYMPEE